MMRALYSSVAGLKSHQTAMDVVGNNISNVNTYGYKTQRTTFRDAYYQTIQGSSDSTKDLGGVNALQIGYGSGVATIDTNHEIGGYASTGYTMDCYIDGEGYFVATDSSGNAYLTRVGGFYFDAEGYLVDGNGRYICGKSTLAAADPADPTGNTPLTNADGSIKAATDPTSGEVIMDNATFDANDEQGKFQNVRIRKPINNAGEPVALSSISVGGTGVITGVNKDGQVITVGQIMLANVPNPDGLTLLGDSYWKAMNNVGTFTFETPGHLTGELVTGGLEASNVDLANEVTNMITVQRGYQANSRVINVVDSMLEELVNLKR